MPMDVDTCRLESEKRWHDMSLEIQKLKDKQDEMTARLNQQSSMVQDIQELSTSVSILANNMDAMLKELQKQNARIQTLEMKPAKRFESIVDKVLMLVVAALVGALLIKLGLPA